MAKKHSPTLVRIRKKIVRLGEEHRKKIYENSQLNYQIRQAEAQRVEELAGLAHELRKPLTIIRSLLSRCEAKFSRELIQQTALEIDNEITRATRMLDNILTLSRLELLETHKFESVTFSEIAELAFSQQRKNFPQHTWIAKITPCLQINANAEAIFAICENLIENAGKHSPAGSRITISLKRNKTNLVFSVEDAGKGISRELRKKIVQPRLQYGTTGGFGLGLAVITRAVNKLGGELCFRSKHKQKGSIFVVKLPINSQT